jgi:hypothetical protein
MEDEEQIDRQDDGDDRYRIFFSRTDHRLDRSGSNANDGGTMNIAAIYGVGTADDARHRTASTGASIIYLRSQEAQAASSEFRFRPCVGWLEH